MMYKTTRYMIAMLFFSAAVFAADYHQEGEEIVVALQTESKLLPLYLEVLPSKNSPFDKRYLQSLEKIMRFDLGNNGMTFLVQNDEKKARLLKNAPLDSFGNTREWGRLGVYYVIKVQVEGKTLNARMLSVNANTIRTADHLPLTGDLPTDRKELHRLSDTIHRALFGTPGIATTRILYTVRTQANEPNKWLSEVWESDYDGGNPRQITKGKGYIVTPVYVPPKKGYSCGSFFYVSYKTGQPKIYVGSIQDGDGSRLTYLRGNQLMPAISNKRDKVAFVNDVTGNPDLFIQDFDPEQGPIGKPRQIFKSFRATQGSPVFSPDGKKIAFISNKDGAPRIYLLTIPEPGVPLGQVKAQLLTKVNRENTSPSWSPDGTKLAYSSMTNGTRQIWVYDFQTNKERQLTKGPGHKENPSWAPNSLHLVFNTTENNNSNLYLVNLNQPNATKITSGSEEKRFPNWEPM